MVENRRAHEPLRRDESIVEQELNGFFLLVLGHALEALGASAAEASFLHDAAYTLGDRAKPTALMAENGGVCFLEQMVVLTLGRGRGHQIIQSSFDVLDAKRGGMDGVGADVLRQNRRID